MTIHFTPEPAPESTSLAIVKLANAELRFTEGPLAGLTIIGFSIWRRHDGTRFVRVPTTEVKGISYPTIQPTGVAAPLFDLQSAILAAYRAQRHIA